MTCDGCPAHQVRVGEVQGGVEQEVGLDDPPRSLADVIEQPSAPQGHSSLVAVLQDRSDRMRKPQVYVINATRFSAVSTLSGGGVILFMAGVPAGF